MVEWRKYLRQWREGKSDVQAVPWLLMLSAADYREPVANKEILHALEESAVNYEKVKEALIEWENLSVSKENRVEYEWRLKELRDQLNRLHAAHQQGREEGREEGRNETLKQIVDAMLVQNFDFQTIAQFTGMPLDQIKKMKESEQKEN